MNKLPLSLRLLGAAALLALPFVFSSCSCCYGPGIGFNETPYYRGEATGKADAAGGYDQAPAGYHGQYASVVDQNLYDQGYHNGFQKRSRDIARHQPLRQTQHDAFKIGDEKGRCDRRLGLGQNHRRYAGCYTAKNENEFCKGYARGFLLEAGAAQL